ncbi:MAG: BamA/TamA family outer membrane protein [Planctomycetota bacterium]
MRRAVILLLIVAGCRSTQPDAAVGDGAIHDDPNYRITQRSWERGLQRELESIEREYDPVQGAGLWGLQVNSARNGGQMSFEDQKKPKKKRSQFLFAPVPGRNPTIGWNLALGVGWLHRYDEEDQSSPPSTLGVAGMYSENDSSALFVFYRGYLKRDKWRVAFGAGTAKINYDFFGIGNEGGNAGISIPFRTEFVGGKVGILRRIRGDVFLGLNYLYGDVRTKVRSSATLPPGLRPPAFDAVSSAPGIKVVWDTRDDTFYPFEGTFLESDVSFFTSGLGSTFDYQSYRIAYNSYESLDEQTVLAWRLYGQFTSGEAPFYGLSQFGSGSDLRGYEMGRYRDRNMYALQIEYRRQIWGRFGAVAFVGVGGVSPDLTSFFENPLPSAGVGVRFRLTKSERLNYRIDAAWGKEKFTLYFAVGEAF